MAEDAPQVLLQSALEKIVYFEARLGQLQAQLVEARDEGGRVREELSHAAQREMELRREVAGLQVQLERLRSERGDLQRAHEASRQERAMLMAKLLEASQIHHAGGDVDFDLASFISTLRGEVLARGSGGNVPGAVSAPILGTAGLSAEGFFPGLPPLEALSRPGAPYPGQAPAPVMVESSRAQVTAHAQRLAGEGRLGVSADDLRSLSRQDASTPRSEETLLEFSIRELSAVDVSARVRAADRLKALGQAASAPAIASALHQEKEPAAQVALLRAFSGVANAAGAPVVEPLLSAQNPEVRIAALKALLALEPSQAIPHLSAAVKDPDRSVRRRASLLALGLEEKAALTLGEEALKDPDPEVRGLAALALGATGGERSRALLSELVADGQVKVRQAAAQSLSRILGRDVTGLVHLDDAQRRRELRRLAGVPVNPVRTALPPTAAALREIAAAARPAPPLPTPLRPVAPVVPLAAAIRSPEPRGPATVTVGRTGVALAVAPPPEPDEALCASMVAELRSALRGRTDPELARALGVSARTVDEAVALLCARGQVVRRGLKVYLA